jgi:hypothetical protein
MIYSLILSHSGEESEQVDGSMKTVEHEDGENDILHNFVCFVVLVVCCETNSVLHIIKAIPHPQHNVTHG